MSPTNIKTRIGLAIKTERDLLGISHEELAYRAGLHRTYVSDVQRGSRNVSIESIQKLRGALSPGGDAIQGTYRFSTNPRALTCGVDMSKQPRAFT
jgi:transcriptional regulator with XRE-family HTH domain